MRIGLVTTWFERGAAYVSKIFEEKLEIANDIYIYARGGEEYGFDNEKWNRPNVHWGKRIISPFSSTVINKKDFVKWVKSNNIELVLFNEQHWWQPILWCKELGIKTVAYIDYYTEETMPFFGIYDGLICNTKRHFSAFSWHNNAVYLPWGTDIRLFKPKSNGLVDSRFVTFFHSCGWDTNRKGTDLLLKALCKTKKTEKLIIHTQNEISNSELTPLIKSLTEEGKLEIINKTVHAPGLYYLGDIYVYPTRLEGIGLTVPEALSCGLGIVVPDNPPMNEFVQSEHSRTISIDRLIARKDGYYWPKCESNIDSLALIMDALAENKEDVKKMKLNARSYAEQFLDVNKNFLELDNFIQKITFSKPKESLLVKIHEFETRGIRIFHKFYLKHYFIMNLIRNLIKRK